MNENCDCYCLLNDLNSAFSDAFGAFIVRLALKSSSTSLVVRTYEGMS